MEGKIRDGNFHFNPIVVQRSFHQNPLIKQFAYQWRRSLDEPFHHCDYSPWFLLSLFLQLWLWSDILTSVHHPGSQFGEVNGLRMEYSWDRQRNLWRAQWKKESEKIGRIFSISEDFNRSYVEIIKCFPYPFDIFSEIFSMSSIKSLGWKYWRGLKERRIFEWNENHFHETTGKGKKTFPNTFRKITLNEVREIRV